MIKKSQAAKNREKSLNELAIALVTKVMKSVPPTELKVTPDRLRCLCISAMMPVIRQFCEEGKR